MVSRRTFLRESVSGLSAVVVTPLVLRSLPRAVRAQRVLIAGAGAAGLCAAWELKRAGHEVLVFEPRTVPGGRILTLRSPFADGLYAEAGAMYLGSNTLAVQYAREFGLELTPVPFRADLGSVVYVARERIEMRTGQPVRWPVELGPEDAGQPIRVMQNRLFRSRIAEVEGGLEGLNAADWPRPAHLAYDDVSLAELWRKNGASEGAMQLMRLIFYDGMGEGIESVSALQFMRELGTLLGATGSFQVRGGNDLLPRAFAERLGSAMRYGTRLVAVHQDATGVEVTVEDAGGRQQLRGDQLIITMPFHLLRNLSVTPSLSATRQRAIREIMPTSVTRVYMQCRQRFWEAANQDGSAATDLPIQQLFHTTIAQPGTRGILESYTTAARARRLAAMNPDERLKMVITESARVHPELPRHVEGGTSYCWDNDPWARGDYAYFKPGQIRRFFPHIQRPEGRIHFAGDAVGGIPGWIEGAMRSARAAAEQITRTA